MTFLEAIFVFFGMVTIIRNVYVLLLTHYKYHNNVKYFALSVLFLILSVLFALEKGFVLFSILIAFSLYFHHCLGIYQKIKPKQCL